MDYISTYHSPLGDMLLASDGERLIGLWFEGQKHFGANLSENTSPKELSVFEKTSHWLDLYFKGEIPGFVPPLSPRGSAFQKEVWDILLSIPYGETLTYGEIAKRIAMKREMEKMSSQAIGGAVGHNPISLIIPCHRVVGAGGSLTGYAGGLEKKEKLLAWEKGDKSWLPLSD